MRFIIQRVNSASVTVDGKVISEIGRGILVLVGMCRDDTNEEAQYLVQKAMKCRLWEKDGKTWAANVMDIEGEVLVVSQFTLFGTLKKGCKPDFHQSMGPEPARELYNQTVEMFRAEYKKVSAAGRDKVKEGEFQAMMKIGLENDGPVTLQLDTDELMAGIRQAKDQKKGSAGGDTAAKKQTTAAFATADA